MAAKPPRDKDNRPGGDGQPRRPTETDSSFGSFVSDSVRRSAGRFRGEAGEPRARRRDRAAGESDTGGEPDRFGVPHRRDRQAYTGGPEQERPGPDEREAAPTWPAWTQEAIDRAGSPERALGILAILLIALIALVWLMVSVLGDDGGGGREPTATEVLQVLPIGTPGAASSPGAGPGRDIVTPTPTLPAGVTPTPTQGGSDNVLNQVPSSPAAGAPSASCDEPCLARVERTPEASALLLASGTRPSYANDDWYWVVAEPEGIASISSSLKTEIVRESDDTLRLYMVTLPPGGAGSWAAWELGEVIDEEGSYLLVEAETAPANVRTAIDAGLTVEKVAPAPLGMSQRSGDLPALQEGDIGGLGGEIDAGNLEQIIADMQVMGGEDGGPGTRHYRTTGSQIAAEYLYQKLESYGLNVWYEDFVSWDDLLLVSVVGEIPGRDTGRLYGVMAHFDTISETSGSVAPGADDNASGVAATLEIARVLSEYDLNYSLRFIFLNYEEEGVVGSQEFAADAVAAGDPWEGVFNIDSVGSPRNGDQIVLNADGESIWMMDLLRRVNDAYGLDASLVSDLPDRIVSDDSRFRDKGIESVLIARELYGWSPFHHNSDDVLSNVSIPHVEGAAVLVLLAVAHLMI